jgi:hypothetical protein
MSTKQYFTAICFFHYSKEMQPHKFRNIANIDKFMKFAKEKGYLYVNFYDKVTRDFLYKKWVE